MPLLVAKSINKVIIYCKLLVRTNLLTSNKFFKNVDWIQENPVLVSLVSRFIMCSIICKRDYCAIKCFWLIVSVEQIQQWSQDTSVWHTSSFIFQIRVWLHMHLIGNNIVSGADSFKRLSDVQEDYGTVLSINR